MSRGSGRRGQTAVRRLPPCAADHPNRRVGGGGLAPFSRKRPRTGLNRGENVRKMGEKSSMQKSHTPGVGALGSQLHAPFVDPDESLNRHVVAEPGDDDIPGLGLCRPCDRDHVAVSHPRLVHAVPADHEQVVRTWPELLGDDRRNLLQDVRLAHDRAACCHLRQPLDQRYVPVEHPDASCLVRLEPDPASLFESFQVGCHR